MYRRDYLQRLLEELARSIHGALGLRKEGRNEEALERLRELYIAYFRIDAERIAHVEPAGMLEIFSGEFSLKNEQLEALANVLFAEGELLLVKADRVEADDRFRKALLLFEHLEKADAANFSVQRKNNIATIHDYLSERPA